MSSEHSQQRNEAESTPTNFFRKPIQKTTLPKATFSIDKESQPSQVQLIDSRKSHNQPSRKQSRIYQLSSQQLKQSHLVNEPSKVETQNMKQRISFLEHCLSQYKAQTLSLSSKLTQREKFYKNYKENYDQQISRYKSQVNNLQLQLQGQGKLIEEYLQKYDTQVKQHQQCLKTINQKSLLVQQLNSHMNALQRSGGNAREVSVNCIKENQQLKAQLIIETEKYQILLTDYQLLSQNYQQDLRILSDQNRLLVRKLDELDMELRIHQKDKEIEKLLIYEQSIEKRQNYIIKQQDHPSNTSPYQFIPRRLNFDDQTMRTNRTNNGKENVRDQESQLIKIIDLQKSKINSLETQLKGLEKRNKELQQLMVKLMK